MFEYNKLIDDSIELIYNKCGERLINNLSNYYYSIDKDTIQSIVYESIWESLRVAKINLQKQNKRAENGAIKLTKIIAQNKCKNELTHQNTHKEKANKGAYAKVKEDSYVEPEYEITELNIWAEQIKNNLTTNEYKYIKLIINTPFQLTNAEIARRLEISEPCTLHIKKRLQSKLPSLF